MITPQKCQYYLEIDILRSVFFANDDKIVLHFPVQDLNFCEISIHYDPLKFPPKCLLDFFTLAYESQAAISVIWY
jgi:hypothetical protein